MKSEKQLYQWDVNQYLTELQPTAQFVDYPMGNEVIRIDTEGKRCRIPDEFLQTAGFKTCYERYSDGTYKAYNFNVQSSPKPPDYVYTSEERITFDALVAKADAAIAEIKRRADSGEFTPVKGVDYFTDAEKAEMMESISDGAIGEFREVVDSATADFNENSSVKTSDYNTNAEKKLSTYNSNAEQKLESYNQNHTTKLTTYDTNAEQHTSDYNTNAEKKLSTYNSNATEKFKAYNDNHTEKVAEYNQNAETKTAEFDSNAAALREQIAEKANVDGYYEEMTVGDAEQLIATQFVEDNEPYLFRPTGGPSDVGNRAYLDKIVGGTVAWNQLICSEAIGLDGTLDIDGGVYTLTPNISSDFSQIRFYNATPHTRKSGHKYYVSIEAKSDAWASDGNIAFCTYDGLWLKNAVTSIDPSNHSWQKLKGIFANTIDATGNGDFSFRKYYEETNSPVSVKNAILFDLTQMFGSTIADYIYSLEQSQAGAGVAWFKKLFPKDYYEYNAGELLSVEGLESHDTVGFNQWDEEWEVGDISTSTGEDATATNIIRSKGFIPCLPNVQYCFTASDGSLGTALLPFFYDADKQFVSVGSWSNVQNVQATPQNCRYMRFKVSETYGTTYKNDICINLSDPSRNGEYEPHEKHSYPLDSSLTLRGIPKLDASNNLYYDGDEYASDGKVTRKYGAVDLGTLNWIGSDGLLHAAPTNFALPSSYLARAEGFIFSNKYSADTQIAIDANKMTDKTALRVAGHIYIKDSTYTDAATFKAAMSGVMFVYELATPTTETAEPYNEIQICDDFGTEEFVSTGIVPVGHKTRYPANLRDKLQHLPDLASMDGTYLIQQSDKQMSLVYMPAVFPETPTEDGTYTLKTVVTGGVATLQWVAE